MTYAEWAEQVAALVVLKERCNEAANMAALWAVYDAIGVQLAVVPADSEPLRAARERAYALLGERGGEA